MKPAAAIIAALAAVIGGLMSLMFTTTSTGDSSTSCTGEFGGSLGAAATGEVVMAQANIPQRSGMRGFRASMPRVLSHHPDIVTLNEQAGRSLDQILSAAPGYDAYRNPSRGAAGQATQARDTVVLWRATTWHRVAAGRIKFVSADHVHYDGRLRVWNRYATWVVLANANGQTLAVVSVHHMTNPDRVGPDRPRRRQQYAQGMDALLGLTASLAANGPVFIGGDFNVHPSQADEPWTAPAKMATNGYRSYAKDVDYLFYPASQGVRRTGGWSGRMASDHPWISASFSLPTHSASSADAVSTPSPQAAGLDATQAANAAKIVAAARAKNIYPGYPDGLPVRAQAIALMTALGESGLRVVAYGDAAGPDSRGLFQQRGNGAWGSLTDRMDPTISATNFYQALIRVPGWQTTQPTLAAHAPQRNADPTYYTQFWDQAVTILSGLGGNPAISNLQLATGAPTCAGGLALVAGNGTFGYPVPASMVSSDKHNYGHTGSRWTSTHTGTDFAVSCGTPVLAVNSGTVQLASTWWGGANMVGITGEGVTTWYAHMESRNVATGQQVAVGQQIGLVGAEGNATGCHLHLEVRIPGTAPGVVAGATDPSVWLHTHISPS